jgi:quinoprotein glucose dehydrogenase
LEKAEVYCLRCHKLGGLGGEVGPDLSKVAADPAKTREYLLESIVEPNRQIAKGFDSVIVATDDGRIVAGVLKGEDERELRLMTPEGKLAIISQDEIDERSRGQSAMPDKLIGALSKSELRDLVEFLTGLK